MKQWIHSSKPRFIYSIASYSQIDLSNQKIMQILKSILPLKQTLCINSMTIIIGLLCVTAPKNCTTFGWRISCSTSSSSLNALLQYIQTVRIVQREEEGDTQLSKSTIQTRNKWSNSMETTHTLFSSTIRSSSSFLTATGMPLHVAFLKVP